MNQAESSLQAVLNQLAEQHRLRRLKTIEQPKAAEITFNHHRVVNFCSNDYLGFSQHPALIEASQKALVEYGVGTGGARLIGGTYDLHTQLEQQLVVFKQTEAALVFNSGYQANVGILSALVNRHDVIFADRLNHASLLDGALLSRARLVRYPHNDVEALENLLKRTQTSGQRFIVTDTVFSMDGDLAPLKALYHLATRYDAWLILDEAHATGVFGETHRSGLWETTGLGHQPQVIQVGTFSKALGSFGAYVAASQAVIDTLIQFSRSFIYSTALPPPVVAANLAAIELLQQDASHTQQLWGNIYEFARLAKGAGLSPETNSAIIPILVGDESKTLALTDQFLAAGFYVQGIRPPTVPEGTARLRVTLSTKHSFEQIEKLVQALSHFVYQR